MACDDNNCYYKVILYYDNISNKVHDNVEQ